VIDESSIDIWFFVNIIDSVQSILKSFIHSDFVTLRRFVSLHSNCPVHICFLVYITELVLSQWSALWLTPLFLLRSAYQRHPICLLILVAYRVDIVSSWMIEGLSFLGRWVISNSIWINCLVLLLNWVA